MYTQVQDKGAGFLSKWIISQTLPSDVEKCHLLEGGWAVIPPPPRAPEKHLNLQIWEIGTWLLPLLSAF